MEGVWEKIKEHYESLTKRHLSVEEKLDAILRRQAQTLVLLNQLVVAEKPPKHSATAVKLLFGPIGDTMASAILHMTDHSVTATIVATDAKGNVVVLPSAPTWSMGTAGIATMTVAPDGMSATFAPAGSGKTTVDVVAEGDPVAGVDTLHGSGDITVLAAEATGIALNFGPVS
jgi:hypothetical protein